MSTDAHSPPRDPAAYRPTIHFKERFSDLYDEYNRHLDGDIISGCIEDGECKRVGPGVYHFHEEFGGVTYRVVINLQRGVVVTAHPTKINCAIAEESGRWSTPQIEDIAEFIAAKHTE